MVAEKEITMKIWGDLALRNVDPLGLRVDVCAMLGGGLGQVIQALLDDPTNVENETMVGGTNDSKSEIFPTNEANNIDRLLTKLALAAEEVPEKRFVLLKQIRH